MKLRLFAAVLALLFATTPVLGLVCQMNCGQPPTAPTCHESMAKPDGPIVRGAQHPCDHDHTGASPALLATTAAQASLGALVAVPVPTFPDGPVPEFCVALLSMHGPPGLSGRSKSSLTTILRI